MDSTDVPSKTPPAPSPPISKDDLPPEARAVVAAEKDIPPFPDRNTTTTLWISVFLGLIGLDHFYLRSPKTGLVKLLTLGGLGVWWLWDILQLAAESTRVANYGLSTPFDLAGKVGQGQLTTGATHIRQRTDYFNWLLSAFMDIVGLTALIEGRPAAFLRRLIDGVLMISFVSAGTLFGYLMAAIFAFFTIVPSFFTLMAVFSPETLATKGVHIPQNLVKLLNFFESWTGVIGPNATAVVRQDFGLAAVDPTTAPHTFGYANEEELVAEQEAAAATTASEGKKKELQSWPISMLLGNVFGGMVLGIVNLFTWIPTVKMGLLAADSYFAAVRISRGQTPDAPDIGGLLPPGVGALAEKATGLASAVEKAKGLASVVEVATNPAALLEQAVAKQKEALGQVKQSIQQKVASTLVNSDPEPTHNSNVNLDPQNTIRSQGGGARQSSTSTGSLSTESLVLGTTIIALIAGGAIKMAVDSLSDN